MSDKLIEQIYSGLFPEHYWNHEQVATLIEMYREQLAINAKLMKILRIADDGVLNEEPSEARVATYAPKQSDTAIAEVTASGRWQHRIKA